MKRERTFDDYFGFDAIVRKLARMRVSAATTRNGDYMRWRLSEAAKAPELLHPTPASDYLPPRRYWVRLRQEQRVGLTAEQCNLRAIVATVRKARQTGLVNQPWGRRLIELVDEVSRRISPGNRIEVGAPVLHLMPKAGDRWSMRCLASYANMADRLILSGASDYMRDVFDGMLDDCCYAFRKTAAFSHQTALEDLVRYRMSYQGTRLYVAECDIQKFFDVIHHDVVLAAYDMFAQNAAQKPDPRMRSILIAYLKSYTSSGNLAACTDPHVVALRDRVKPVASTGVGAFYPGEKIEKLPIGIPQGGALSPVIANIVLDAVDRAVASGADEKLFYARFCDDMVIVHPKRKVCHAALERYVKALEMLRLPVHQIRKSVKADADYYDRFKSKGPFLWDGGDDAPKSAIPWVSFLGVHVGYDGQVRIRKNTIEKHIEALEKERSAFLRAVGRGGRSLRVGVEKNDAIRSFERRLASIGVGYSTINDPIGGARCWMSAFPRITRSSFALNQMRKMDSVRGRIVASVKKHIGSKGQGGFLGRPYSYFGYLKNVERHRRFPGDARSYSEWA